MEDKKENREQNWWNFIWSHIRGALFEEDPRDIISSNAKSVLIGLFILIGLAIIFYAITISAPYFTITSDKSEYISNALSHSPINLSSLHDQVQKQVDQTLQLQNNITNSNESNNNIIAQLRASQEIANSFTQAESHSTGNLSQIHESFTDLQRRDQQLEQINSVFIAAIAGALALGGTLITQLWGRKE